MQRLDFQQPRPVPFPMLLGCQEEAAHASSASHAPLFAFRLVEWRSQSPNAHYLGLFPTWSSYVFLDHLGDKQNVKPGSPLDHTFEILRSVICSQVALFQVKSSRLETLFLLNHHQTIVLCLHVFIHLSLVFSCLAPEHLL